MSQINIFDDTETAFELKSRKDLDWSIFLFRFMGSRFLVNTGSFLTRFALKFRLPVQGLIRKSVFRQFCGGITEKECQQVTEELYKFKLHSILDYSVEGKQTEEQFNSILHKKLELIRLTGEREELSFAVFKLTALCPSLILEKVSAGIELNEEEIHQWLQAKLRVDQLCAYACEKEVRLYADAEESWMQEAVDNILNEMMQKYNKKMAIVYNTIQCYRWDRLEYLRNLHKESRNYGFRIGAKIVRGAYFEKENQRAAKLGYDSPICESKAATDANFRNIMQYCFTHLQDIHLFIGTHNEESICEGIQLMKEYRLERNDPRIWFAQLYGMSDHISYNLSRRGYNAVKLIPFGPVEDVIPYLLRRAEENTSVEGQAGRELSLLQKEKRRRSMGNSLNPTGTLN